MPMTAAAPVCACQRASLSAFDTCLRVSVTRLRVSVTCLRVSVSPSLTRWMQVRLRTVSSNKMARELSVLRLLIALRATRAQLCTVTPALRATVCAGPVALKTAWFSADRTVV
jgi:hypothetical protein